MLADADFETRHWQRARDSRRAVYRRTAAIHPNCRPGHVADDCDRNWRRRRRAIEETRQTWLAADDQQQRCEQQHGKRPANDTGYSARVAPGRRGGVLELEDRVAVVVIGERSIAHGSTSLRCNALPECGYSPHQLYVTAKRCVTWRRHPCVSATHTITIRSVAHEVATSQRYSGASYLAAGTIRRRRPRPRRFRLSRLPRRQPPT